MLSLHSTKTKFQKENETEIAKKNNYILATLSQQEK